MGPTSESFQRSEYAKVVLGFVVPPGALWCCWGLWKVYALLSMTCVFNTVTRAALRTAPMPFPAKRSTRSRPGRTRQRNDCSASVPGGSSARMSDSSSAMRSQVFTAIPASTRPPLVQKTTNSSDSTEPETTTSS